jgi:hypothetical protein
MPTPVKFDQYPEDLRHGVHDFSSDTLKAMLLNTEPDAAADAVKADLPAEIAAGSGYTAGGVTLVVSSSGQAGGTYKLVIDDSGWTASGGSIGPARYVVVYNDTPTSPADPLICYWDYGVPFTLASGETLDLDFSAANGLISGT